MGWGLTERRGAPEPQGGRLGRWLTGGWGGTLQKQLRELRLESTHKPSQEGQRCLEEAGDGAAVGLIQEQGAENVVEEARVVPAGSLTVRVEVHLQDLRLHHPLPWWHRSMACLTPRSRGLGRGCWGPQASPGGLA